MNRWWHVLHQKRWSPLVTHQMLVSWCKEPSFVDRRCDWNSMARGIENTNDECFHCTSHSENNRHEKVFSILSKRRFSFIYRYTLVDYIIQSLWVIVIHRKWSYCIQISMKLTAPERRWQWSITIWFIRLDALKVKGLRLFKYNLPSVSLDLESDRFPSTFKSWICFLQFC